MATRSSQASKTQRLGIIIPRRLAGPNVDGHWTDLEAQASHVGVSHLRGYAGPIGRDENWQLYGSVSPFVMPSHREDLVVVIAEPLACGVSCVATHKARWEALVSHCRGWRHPGTQIGLDDALGEPLRGDRQTLRKRSRVESSPFKYHTVSGRRRTACTPRMDEKR
jgi:hypothetical protein